MTTIAANFDSPNSVLERERAWALLPQITAHSFAPLGLLSAPGSEAFIQLQLIERRLEDLTVPMPIYIATTTGEFLVASTGRSFDPVGLEPEEGFEMNYDAAVAFSRRLLSEIPALDGEVELDY